MGYVVHFVMGYLLWVLLVWPFDPSSANLLAAGAGGDLAVGAAVAALSAAIFGRLFPRHAGKLLSPLRYCFFLYFLLLLIWALASGVLDAAYRVLHLRVPVRPSIVKVRTSMRSEMGRFCLANCITLAAASLTVDMVGQDIYVYWADTVTDSPELRAEVLVGRFEGVLKRVFD